MSRASTDGNDVPSLAPELKAKWVAALRGGEIQQATGSLLDDAGRMCCIGVLGRILGIADDALRDGAFSLGSTKKADGLQPLDDCGIDLGGRHQLAMMNDGQDKWAEKPQSFAQIADWIEANL